jgi:hypothetical protein
MCCACGGGSHQVATPAPTSAATATPAPTPTSETDLSQDADTLPALVPVVLACAGGALALLGGAVAWWAWRGGRRRKESETGCKPRESNRPIGRSTGEDSQDDNRGDDESDDVSEGVVFDFVDAAYIKGTSGPLPVHQAMLAAGCLRPVRLGTRECLTFMLNCCVAVSYVWMSPEHPDPEGEQADALREWLRRNPHITKVWMDWCSLPQGERTPVEQRKFKRGLAHVNLVYLSCYVVKVLNSQYAARFWPQYEAWLSFHRFCAAKMDFAPDPVHRTFSIFTGLAADLETEQARHEWAIVERWSDASVQTVIERLGRSDVAVTNGRDKPKQFAKIRELRMQFQALEGSKAQV